MPVPFYSSYALLVLPLCDSGLPVLSCPFSTYELNFGFPRQQLASTFPVHSTSINTGTSFRDLPSFPCSWMVVVFLGDVIFFHVKGTKFFIFPPLTK